MSFLQIQNLDAGYDNAIVLRGVSLQVDEGEAVAVVGKNGAGKTTLMLSMFGGTRIKSGEISVGGTRIERAPGYLGAQCGVAISPQGRHILEHLTIRENLLLGAAVGRRGHWDLAAVYKVFPFLKDRSERSGTALSGGQQQMLAIARALIANPRVLVLDEPTEGVSPVLIDEIVKVLIEIRRGGIGILVVEQHLNLVRRVTDRFVVMAKGEIIDQGSTADIDQPIHRASLAL